MPSLEVARNRLVISEKRNRSVRRSSIRRPSQSSFQNSHSHHNTAPPPLLGFYDHSHFYRVVPNFLVQFGITYNPDLKNQPTILDDPKKDPAIPFELGTISFAGSGPNSRTTQLFISYGSSPSLGRELWETPVGKVVGGIEHAQAFYSYGDMPPWGKGPVQGKIHNGRQYIETNFPLTDSFDTCQVERFPSRPPKVPSSQEEKQGILADPSHPRVRLASEWKLSDAPSQNVYVVLAAATGTVAIVILLFKTFFPSQKKDNKRS